MSHTKQVKILDEGEYTNVQCHEEKRACLVRMGGDFEYCPFCGDEP